jgi:hypothetical protein
MNIREISALAREVENTDPIDWGNLSVSEEEAYLLMASSVVEMLEKMPDDEKLIVCAASLTKMLVENFTLNLRLSKGI